MNLERVIGTVSRAEVERVTLADARSVWWETRAAFGLGGWGGPADAPALLTPPDGNRKLGKGAVPIYGLTLAHADSAGLGVNVCPWASRGPGGCVAVCTVGAGGNARFPMVTAARAAKVALLRDAPAVALRLLVDELERVGRRHRRAAVRLNVASDVRWERVAPWLLLDFGTAGGGPLRFYDYTKADVADRAGADVLGYHLTFSARRAGVREDERLRAVLDAGRNVAVVFRGGLPSSWSGFRVVDGDRTDERWRDPSPVVVGLVDKGLGRSAPLGFVRAAEVTA